MMKCFKTLFEGDPILINYDFTVLTIIVLKMGNYRKKCRPLENCFT